MARYRTHIDVAARPETVFAFLEDFTNAADWDAGVQSAERLDEGPIGVGSRFGLDLLVGGRTQRWVYEVEEHTAPRTVTFVTRKSSAVGIDAVTIEPSGEGVRVTWDATFTFTGLVGKVIDPVFNVVFQRIGSKAVAGLRPALAALAFAED